MCVHVFGGHMFCMYILTYIYVYTHNTHTYTHTQTHAYAPCDVRRLKVYFLKTIKQASDALAEGLCRENIEREVLSVAGAGKHQEVQDVLDVVDGEVFSVGFRV
jgi:hypothetical protein